MEHYTCLPPMSICSPACLPPWSPGAPKTLSSPSSPACPPYSSCKRLPTNSDTLHITHPERPFTHYELRITNHASLITFLISLSSSARLRVYSKLENPPSVT